MENYCVDEEIRDGFKCARARSMTSGGKTLKWTDQYIFCWAPFD
jgi:hypothetical protein